MNRKEDSIHAFVISWVGKHANSMDIAARIRNRVSRVSIIYSDPDSELTLDTSCETVRVSDEWYWGGKFKTCLGRFDSDLMLVIQGDVTCDDWESALAKCAQCFSSIEKIGIYAPLVDYTYFDLGKTQIERLGNSSLSAVAIVDGIVFAVSRAVANRLKQLNYDENRYGWGTGWAASSFAYSHGLVAVLDESVKVLHPRSRGYDTETARKQMNQFLKQLNFEECIQLALLQSHVKARKNRVGSMMSKPAIPGEGI